MTETDLDFISYHEGRDVQRLIVSIHEKQSLNRYIPFCRAKDVASFLYAYNGSRSWGDHRYAFTHSFLSQLKKVSTEGTGVDIALFLNAFARETGSILKYRKYPVVFERIPLKHYL